MAGGGGRPPAGAFACAAWTRTAKRNGRAVCATARDQTDVENVVIIGSGPAGYTAAIYAARASLRPVVLEGLRAGVAGGQLMTTSDVENYPGFVEGIAGPTLMSQFRAQAARWGAEILTDDAVALDIPAGGGAAPVFSVGTRAHGTFRTSAVIFATGASARRLRLPSEELFWSRGISACATCDGPLFARKDVAVVGGGDSAAEEAYFMTRYASHVHMLVRGPRMRASQAMQRRVQDHPRITVHFQTTPLDVYGATRGDDLPGTPLRGVRVRSTTTGDVSDLAVRGVFYAIGHSPNTELLEGSAVKRDADGYVRTVPGTPETSVAGFFAAGDVQDRLWRQAVTAAGSGCAAALAVERYLTEKGLVSERGGPGVAAEEREERRSVEEEPEAAEDKQTFELERTKHKGQYALRRLYHESGRPILVKFVSPTCGPCAQLRPILDKVVDEFQDRIHYVEIDIAVDDEVAESAGVSGTPTVQIFLEKAKVSELRGVKMRSDYRKALNSCLAPVGAG